MVSLRSDLSYEAFYKSRAKLREEKKTKTDGRRRSDEKTSLTAARETRLFIMKRKNTSLAKTSRISSIRHNIPLPFTQSRLYRDFNRDFTGSDVLEDFDDFVSKNPPSILRLKTRTKLTRERVKRVCRKKRLGLNIRPPLQTRANRRYTRLDTSDRQRNDEESTLFTVNIT